MQTEDGFVPVLDKEDIFFANTAVKDDTDKSELLQLFLRKDVFEDDRYPELSKAIQYFKQTEGGRSEMCKTVEDYARSYAEDYAMQERSEERLDAIQRMIRKSYSKEEILDLGYSEEEYKKAEQGLLVHA